MNKINSIRVLYQLQFKGVSAVVSPVWRLKFGHLQNAAYCHLDIGQHKQNIFFVLAQSQFTLWIIFNACLLKFKMSTLDGSTRKFAFRVNLLALCFLILFSLMKWVPEFFTLLRILFSITLLISEWDIVRLPGDDKNSGKAFWWLITDCSFFAGAILSHTVRKVYPSFAAGKSDFKRFTLGTQWIACSTVQLSKIENLWMKQCGAFERGASSGTSSSERLGNTLNWI